ncbi:DUF397 domain-containing protein [Streptomyces sp. NPDC052701]|uniref:DUF397 domain-containing protein n=1 Tax=Streptomyces sp. NPDC052701 TaxID=3155533 RepID=UPI003424A1DF
MTSALTWFKSSYSGNDEPDCVEVAIPPAHTTVHVRDSKNRTGPRLAFAGGSWVEFVGFAARRGGTGLPPAG